jgi:hypothetical protein
MTCFCNNLHHARSQGQKIRHEICLYLNFKFYMHNFPGLLFNNVTVLIILAMPKCYCLLVKIIKLDGDINVSHSVSGGYNRLRTAVRTPNCLLVTRRQMKLPVHRNLRRLKCKLDILFHVFTFAVPELLDLI